MSRSLRPVLLLLSLLGLSFATGVAQARSAPLVEPPPIVLPSGAVHEDVLRAVQYAVGTSGWQVGPVDGDRVTATYAPEGGKHVVRVGITVGESQVTIGYIDSTNLNYEESGDRRSIHPAYMQWSRALRDDIERRIADGVPADATIPTAPVTNPANNPPPTEAFGAFGRFEAVPATLNETYEDAQANADVMRNFQHALDITLVPTLDEWNASAAPDARILRIEPRVEHVRFISTATRIFAGRMAGGSYILVTVRYVDAATGSVVASPEFYLAAEKGAFGNRTDYAMIEEAGAAVAKYTRENHDTAVGGGTRAPQQVKAAMERDRPDHKHDCDAGSMTAGGHPQPGKCAN